MTPTATKTRAKPNIEDGLTEREAKLTKARADADALGREYGTKLRQAQALADERRQLIYHQPELVDHLGVPVGPDNPVGEIDKRIAELGDLEDLGRQVEHARQLERSAKQSWDGYVAAHYSELIDNRRGKAAAIADEVNEAAPSLRRLAPQVHRVPLGDRRVHASGSQPHRPRCPRTQCGCGPPSDRLVG